MRRVPFRMLAAALLAGCYTNAPFFGSRPEPAPGTRLVIELTDQGRVGMDRQVGSEVATVEGTLVSRSDTTYVVAVSTVLGLYGSVAKWQGERVTFRAEYIRRMSERRFSMGRTVTAAGLATAAFLGFALTRSLVGGGNDGGGGPEPPPPNGN